MNRINIAIISMFLVIGTCAPCLAEESTPDSPYKHWIKKFGGNMYMDQLQTKQDTVEAALIILREIGLDKGFFLHNPRHFNESFTAPYWGITVQRKNANGEDVDKPFQVFLVKFLYGNSFFYIGIIDHNQDRDGVFCPSTAEDIKKNNGPKLIHFPLAKKKATGEKDLFVCVRIDVESHNILSSKTKKLAADSFVSDCIPTFFVACDDFLSGFKPLVCFDVDAYGVDKEYNPTKTRYRYFFSLADMEWVAGLPPYGSYSVFVINTDKQTIFCHTDGHEYITRKLENEKHSVLVNINQLLSTEEIMRYDPKSNTIVVEKTPGGSEEKNITFVPREYTTNNMYWDLRATIVWPKKQEQVQEITHEPQISNAD